MSRLRISPLPGIPFIFEGNGVIALDVPAGKEPELEALFLRAIEDLHSLPPTTTQQAQPAPRIQPPNVSGGQGIRPPPQPHSLTGGPVRPGGAPAPPPAAGAAIPGVSALPQPIIKGPPRPLFEDQSALPQVAQPARQQAQVIARVIPQQQGPVAAVAAVAGTSVRVPNNRLRLGPGHASAVAAAAKAEEDARIARALPPAAPVAGPNLAAMNMIPMSAPPAMPAPLADNQTPDGRLINPDTGQPYRPATHDENGKPIVPLPQPALLAPPPPPK